MKLSAWFGVGAFVTIVGCGGNTNSASPFSNTTAAGGDPVGRGTKVSARASAAGNRNSLPVFLTIRPESLTKDAWLQLQSIEVQGTKSSESIFPSTQGLAIRLSALRDVQGRRYVYVGEATRTEPLVRTVVTVDSRFVVDEPGLDKPVTGEWGGSFKSPKPGQSSYTLNLDPNAEFTDAIVLELSMSGEEAKLDLALSLSPAIDVFAPERQERAIFVGKLQPPFGLKVGSKVIPLTKGSETGSFELPSAKDTLIGVSTYFAQGRGLVASAYLPYSSEMWRGRVISSTERIAITPTMSLSMNGVRSTWTAPESAEPRWSSKADAKLTDKSVLYGWDPSAKKSVTSFAVEGTVAIQTPAPSTPQKAQPESASKTKS